MNNSSIESSEEEICCQCCFDEITEEDNMVKYQINQNPEWLISNYCETCVDYLQNKSWKIFTDSVEKADCRKALQKILEVGPPINLRDRAGFPNPNDNNLLTEIDKLYYCSEKKEKSAKVIGSLIGVEREKYITFLENFKFHP